MKLESSKISFNDNNGVKDNVPLKNDTINDDFALVNEKSELNSVTNDAPSRGAVLRACTVTSGLIAALGLAIRQVSLAVFDNVLMLKVICFYVINIINII